MIRRILLLLAVHPVSPNSQEFLMISRYLLSSALVLGLSGAFAGAAYADDLTLISSNTSQGKTTVGKQYLGDNKMRIDDGAGSDMIFDYESGTLTFIEHKKKKYWQATVQEMQAQMEQMSAILDSNPITDRMLGSIGDVQVDEMGESKTIAGHSCDMVQMTMGEGFTTEMCVARDLELPISYYDARKAMSSMMGPMAKRFEKMYDEMEEIKGLSIETVTRAKMMGRSMDSTSVVTEIKVGPLPAGAFDIPADYKKKKSPYE
jgi:hypothetical protein